MTKLEKYKEFISYYEPFEINEGLIRSVDPAITLSKMPILLSSKNINSEIEITANGQIFIVLKNIDKLGINFLFSLLSNFGYFVSEMLISGVMRKFNKEEIDSLLYVKKNINLTIYIEPHYDLQIINLPDVLYHATSTLYVDKILKNGLSPKSKEKIASHPPRIYLCDNLNKTIAIGKLLRSGTSNFNIQWVILEINSKKISDFKIYEDPNYKDSGGCYTLNYIPPTAISSTNIQF